VRADHYGLRQGASSTRVADDRQVILKEVELIGSWYSRPADHPVMVDLVQRGLDVGRMITHRFGIEQAQEAYDTFHSGKGTKVVIHPWTT
jgi:threonine dehydrogenase-like Zn-dependent dehydrogenase